MDENKLTRNLVDGITNHISLNDIRILIASGADVNGIVSHGLHPLHFAIYEGDYECARLLLIRGCDVNASDAIGYTALHMAAEKGHFHIVKLLIEFQAKITYLPQNSKLNINDKNCKEIGQETLDISEVSSRDVLPGEIIVEEPLRLAIKNGHYAIANFLLNNGANPNQRYFLGSEINLIDPIKDIEYLELLLKYGSDPNVNDRSGINPLMQACRSKGNSLNAIKLLVEHGADVNSRSHARLDFKTPLHYAVIGGSIPVIEYLSQSGAVFNLPSDYDWATPLDFAILKNSPDLVEALMRLGADPNRCSDHIGTSLHVACSNELSNQERIIEILLKYGADPNLRCYNKDDQYFWTPLVEYININENKTLHFVQLLLNYGAQAVFRLPYLDNRGLLKCLHKLNQYPQIFRLILENGQNFDVESIKRRRLMSPQHKSLLLSSVYAPKSLKHYAKIYIRQNLKTNILSKINSFNIPTTLKLYLCCL
ncbi:unnamed protein product [Gordionus sp. m RMFG-2023]|uniref:ankyrin-1-like n=1 Tax=Gordionus sp. m RMFG-2023 TaxID=3053472 RepID=UPI0030E554B2